MKLRKLKQIIAYILVVFILCTPLYASNQTEVQVVARANLTLSEMKYEHIEYTEVETLIKALEPIIQQEDTESFYSWDKEFYELYCKVNTMIQIAQLNYRLHNRQSYYFEEYLYSVELLGKIKSVYAKALEEDALSEDMTKYYGLSIERSKLVDEYITLGADTTIEVNGKSRSLIDIAGDEAIDNEEFAKLYNEWYTAYNLAAGEILLKLVKLDNQMAKIEGHDTYVESIYEQYSRDYTSDDARRFIASVKEVISPVFASLYKYNLIAIELLKNYSYKNDEVLMENIDKAYISKYPELQQVYNYMKQYRLYDIETRSDKEIGGFTTYFTEYAEPFMVLNYEVPYQTALTFLHEFGHYFTYYTIGESKGGLDLDETFSQANELLAMPYYKEILGEQKYADAAQIYTIENMLGAVIQGCLYDEFLREVYNDPNITVEEMNTLYQVLAKSYGLNVDGRSWCIVSHNFEMPFYYISYSVSAITALEMWAESLEENGLGMKMYLDLIKEGKKHTFFESIKNVGLANPLEEATLKKVTNTIQEYFKLSSKVNKVKDVA